MRRTLGLIATVALAACTPDEPRYQGRSLTSWRTSLASPVSGERRQACQAMAALGPDGAPAVPQLVALLGDAEVGPVAARALTAVGADAIAPLERRLAVEVPAFERLYAAHALVQLVPAHDLATSVLVESFAALRDAALAARALELVVVLGPALAPRIATLVEDPYVPLRVRALEALGGMGEKAREQTAVVLSQLGSPEPAVRRAAVQALALVGPAAAVLGPLRQATHDEDEGVASAATQVLIRLEAR